MRDRPKFFLWKIASYAIIFWIFSFEAAVVAGIIDIATTLEKIGWAQGAVE